MQKSMYAGVLKEKGNIEFCKVTCPSYDENEVVVRVKCAGICGSDVPRVKVYGTYSLPMIPGHEISGIVEAKGKKVNGIKIGDRVSVYPLIPCKSCDNCKAGNYNLCDNYGYIGSRCDGGFAELVKCPKENIIRLPDNVSFEEGALIEPISVALHAIKKSAFKPDDTAVILGLGPIGLFTAQWLRILGASLIIGIDRNKEKINAGKKNGFDFCIDSGTDFTKQVLEITNNKGANVIFECSGSKNLQEESIALAKKDGTVVFIGNPKEDITIKKNYISSILRNELRIIGSWNSNLSGSSVSEWDLSLQHLKDKKISVGSVITHRFELSKIADVFDELYKKKFVHGKVVFVM